MMNNRRHFLLGSLLFILTVTCLVYTRDFRTVIGERREDPEIRADHQDHGCFTINNLFDNKRIPKADLQERGCTQRLPDVLIIGSKKCGTTTLKNFMSVHPQIAAAEKESHFYDTRTYMGLDWFLGQMPYALPNQLVVEKTPRYFVYPDVQQHVRRDLSPDIKLILILRDPVIRAISDFTHVAFKRYMQESKETRDVHENSKPTLSPKQLKLRKVFKALEAQNNRMYPSYSNIGATFEESVLTSDGELDLTSAIIDTGIYVKYLRKWLQYYSSDQILVLDGETLVVNPYEILHKVEKFLGIQEYFTPEHFYFNVQKRFFCLSKPIFACMKAAKGRAHTSVSDSTIEKLKQFYRPYNLELEGLLNRTFSWT